MNDYNSGRSPSGIHRAWKLRLRSITVIGLVLLALVGVGFWSYDRGRTAWEDYKKESATKGRSLEWRDNLPSTPPPEAENFAATPLLRRVGRKGQSSGDLDAHVTATGLVGLFGNTGDWANGKPENLSSIARTAPGPRSDSTQRPRAMAALAILDALSALEPELKELREASRRPFAKFEFKYPDPISADVPNFVLLRQLGQISSLHASAALELGKADAAFDDLRVIHRLAEAAGHEPTLVAAMIGVALHGLELQAFWEGWIAARWSDSQWLELQEHFASVNLLASIESAMNTGERAGFNYIMENSSNRDLVNLFSLRGGATKWWETLRDRAVELQVRLAPRSWRHANLLFYNRLLDESVVPSVDARGLRVSVKKCEEFNAKLSEALIQHRNKYLFAAMAIPNFGKATQTTARNQTAVNQASIVCALERYRRNHGGYPSSLEALAPQWIKRVPHDLITGEPLKYRRTPDGKFLLYSVGWNGRDDGGVSDAARSDWVWPVTERREPH